MHFQLGVFLISIRISKFPLHSVSPTAGCPNAVIQRFKGHKSEEASGSIADVMLIVLAALYVVSCS
jgi:hypothetical protein